MDARGYITRNMLQTKEAKYIIFKVSFFDFATVFFTKMRIFCMLYPLSAALGLFYGVFRALARGCVKTGVL